MRTSDATSSFALVDNAMLSMHVPPTEVAREISTTAAVNLCELERLSAEAGARLIRVPRVAFLAKVVDLGVDICGMTEAELLAGLNHA
ncbi:UPF0175 family protein [Sorangium sp. So ce1128]